MVKCTSYEYQEVKKAVNKGIELIGGCASLVREGEKILLKPNLLAPDPPEKCVTTHPAVFKAVAEAFLETGAALFYGDSPALGSPERTAQRTGIRQVGEELNLTFADFKQGQEIFFPQGKQNKKFVIAQGVLDCDGLISIAKLKTHGLTRLTGAIKNQFGCIPGVLKGEFHVKLPRVEDFALMLVDLNRLLAPRLYIMDGIMAMEGNGPRGGKAKAMHVLLFSRDPVALDATVCRMVGLSPEAVETLIQGQENGLGTFNPDQIEIIGEPLATFTDNTFIADTGKRFPSLTNPAIKNMLVPRPRIEKEKCIRCGICVEMCPVKPPAVHWNNDNKEQVPVFNYELCIRCYCCQEICPEGAVYLETPLLGRLLAALKPN